MLPVEPDIGILEYPVQPQLDLRIRRLMLQREMLAVPAFTTDEVALRAVSRLPVKRTDDIRCTRRGPGRGIGARRAVL